MSWDTSVPASSDFISLGDDVIRTLKTDLQTALRGNATDGDEAKFPGSDTANPIYRYRGLKGNTGSRPTSGQYGLYINTTLNTLQRDNGSSWEDVATLIPSGTKMPFYQATVPTGWTAVAVNDKFLRVVTSGTTGGTTGGTVAASTSLSHSHTVNSHTHDLGNHTHSTPAQDLDYTTQNQSTVDFGGADTANRLVSENSSGSNKIAYRASINAVAGSTIRIHTNQTIAGTSGAPSSNTSGSATPGTDSQLGVFAYADFVIGTKD